MIVKPAGTSTLFDIFAPLSQTQLAAVLAAGLTRGEHFKGVIRYHDNISAEELNRYHDAGLGVGFVGEAYNDSMANPSTELGQRDGLRAVKNLKTLLGPPLPAGLSIAIDVEGTPHIPGNQIINYVNGAAQVLKDEGLIPTLYFGWGINLSAMQVYQDLVVTGYWASSPYSNPPAVRGFQLTQTFENVPVAGIKVDIDEARPDALGGEFTLLFRD